LGRRAFGSWIGGHTGSSNEGGGPTHVNENPVTRIQNAAPATVIPEYPTFINWDTFTVMETVPLSIW
jgi:hypothetical protein